jgi:tetratricopeptide (TPR) repeat protein
LLLSVGEATGVTEFVPTIIRIVTGEGSLVIEVDDPTVSVTLDGEDVTITGAGVHELRLRPGTHKFVATKDGRPLREEVVSIERNGRRMVKVTRDATVEPIAHELTASEKLQRAKIDLSEADRIRIEATQALEEIKHGAELARLNAAIERNPTDVESLVHRGELYRRLNRLDEAMADYTAALTIAPDHPICVAALSSRGQILTDRGEYKAAIADYEHAIRLAPNNAWPYGRIATIYLFGSDDIRDGQKALDFADQSTQHRDAHRGFHVLRGVCLYRLGRYREAAEALERTYVAEGRTAMNRFYAALSYHQLGDTDKAKKCYEEALKLPQVGGYVGDAIRAEADALLNQ